jgi:hypothetical protein
MGNKRTTPERSASAAPDDAVTDANHGETLGVTSQELTPRDRRFLLKVSRFLLNVREPHVFARAAMHGYSQHEHAEGWRLFRLASGEHRTLDDLAPSEASADERTPKETLQALDAFENQWFPRTRAIIRRFAKEGAPKLEATFFKDLEQQPLGPAVVQSVSTFVQRVEDLRHSKLPGAKEVRAVLAQRGLTDHSLEEIRKLLARVATPATTVPRADRKQEREQRLAEQRRALADLRAWREEWRVTFATVFDARTLTALGLVERKRRKAEDEPDDDEQDT